MFVSSLNKFNGLSVFKLFLRETIEKTFSCIECDKGTYGDGCNEACGHCCDVNQCSDIDGSCLTENSAGYLGYLCKTGEIAYPASPVRFSTNID